jgi:hypothetical protein
MENPYNPEIHHRRSIRLQGYDYSQAVVRAGFKPALTYMCTKPGMSVRKCFGWRNDFERIRTNCIHRMGKFVGTISACFV